MQSSNFCLGATRAVIGLSAIAKIAAGSFQQTANFKILAGGGTLEIVSCPLSLSGSSAVGWGTGYPIGLTENVNINGPVTFYLAASSATMTVALFAGLSQGATLV